MQDKKNYFRECPRCGAHLDPGETCDCGAEGGSGVKTLADLMEAGMAGRTFDDIVEPGDAVAAEIVEDIRDALPPTTNRANLMQSGEPSDYRLDPRVGRMMPTHVTFQRRDGQWYYCGRCFEGDTVEPDKLTGATV